MLAQVAPPVLNPAQDTAVVTVLPTTGPQAEKARVPITRSPRQDDRRFMRNERMGDPRRPLDAKCGCAPASRI